MRAAIVLVLAVPAAADEVAKAQAIAKAGPEAARAAIPELIALGKGAPLERFAARDALAVAGPPAIAKLIGEAGGNPSLRLLLEGVSHDLGAGVVAPALPLLASENPKVRAMAAVSLGAAGAGGEAAVKQLVTALHDKDAEVRREAALAIGRIGRGAHDAIPGLIHLANDPERGMTREALLAMGMIVRDAAERDRPVPKPPPEVARAIESGLAWLLRQQRPDGSWVPEHRPTYSDPGSDARAYITSLAVLAMLETGAPERHASRLRPGLFALLLADTRDRPPSWPSREQMATTFSATARVLGEPECRARAARVIIALARDETAPRPPGWSALAPLEARFAGLPNGSESRVDASAGPAEKAIVLVAGSDSDELRDLIESCGSEPKLHDPFSWALAARARWYAGAKSDALVESVLKRQREDGSWEAEGNPWGPAHATACMLLCLEAASGLAHPLTMPLPDAPQLKAAVATLRIAAQSKDAAIRAAAEQALAGFAVR